MRIHVLFNEGHAGLFEDWFKPSLKDQWEIRVHRLRPAPAADFGTDAFRAVIEEKMEVLLEQIFPSESGPFIVSDVDIQFIKPCAHLVESALAGKDLVFQRERAGDDEVNTGFMVIRPCDATRALFAEVLQRLRRWRPADGFMNEQALVNSMLRDTAAGRAALTWGHFPDEIWAWSNRAYALHRPRFHRIALHHANSTLPSSTRSSLERKIDQLRDVRDYFAAGRGGRIGLSAWHAGVLARDRLHRAANVLEARTSAMTAQVPRLRRTFAKTVDVARKLGSVAHVALHADPKLRALMIAASVRSVADLRREDRVGLRDILALSVGTFGHGGLESLDAVRQQVLQDATLETYFYDSARAVGRMRRTCQRSHVPSEQLAGRFVLRFHPPALLARIQAAARPVVIVSHHHSLDFVSELLAPALGPIVTPGIASRRTSNYLKINVRESPALAYVKLDRMVREGWNVFISIEGAITSTIVSSWFGVVQKFSASLIHIIKRHRPVVVPFVAIPGSTPRDIECHLGADPTEGRDLATLSDREVLELVLDGLREQMIAVAPHYVNSRYLEQRRRVTIAELEKTSAQRIVG